MSVCTSERTRMLPYRVQYVWRLRVSCRAESICLDSKSPSRDARDARDGSGAVAFFSPAVNNASLSSLGLSTVWPSLGMVCMLCMACACARACIHTVYVCVSVCPYAYVYVYVCMCMYVYVRVDRSTHVCAAAMIDWPVLIPQRRQDQPAIVTTVDQAESQAQQLSVGNTCAPRDHAFVPPFRDGGCSRLLGRGAFLPDAAPRPMRAREGESARSSCCWEQEISLRGPAARN